MGKYKLEFHACHRIPERSFFWKGKQLPVCARCTGIHVGYLSLFLFIFGVFSLNWWLSLLLILPTYIDGLVQAFSKYSSNNYTRLFTGIIAGIGTMSIVDIVGKKIALFLLGIL